MWTVYKTDDCEIGKEDKIKSKLNKKNRKSAKGKETTLKIHLPHL